MTEYPLKLSLAPFGVWPYEDGQGSLWLGDVSGVYRLRDRQVARYTGRAGVPPRTPAEGLLDREVYPILQARNGDISVGSIRGLSRFREGAFENTSLPKP